MKSCTALAIACAVLIMPPVLHSQPADSPWPMFHGDVRNTGQSDTLSSLTSKLLWSYETASDVRSSACAGADGTVYFGSDKDDKNIYAVSFKGALIWSYATGDAVQATCALSSGGNIYCGSKDSRFYALTSEGSLVWSYRVQSDETIESPPVEGSDGTVYFGSNDNRLYALSSGGGLDWSYVTAEDIWGGTAIGAGGELYIGSLDNRLYAIGSTGALRWSYRIAEHVRAGVALDTAGNIYGGTSSILTYFFSLTSDGSMRWTFSAVDFYSTPAISHDAMIYAGSGGGPGDGMFFAFDSAGGMAWSYRPGDEVINGTAAIGSNGTVYASSRDNNCYAFDSSGSVTWSYDIGPSECAPSIGSYGTLYVGSDSNVMYAFEGLPTPTPTATPLPNYVGLGANPTSVSPGGTVGMSWQCDFTQWNYQGVPVNIYVAAINDPTVSDAPSSVADALAGGMVFLAADKMTRWYRYTGSVEAPTWSGVVFPPAPTSGTKSLPVPNNPALAGDWVFATAFIRLDTGQFVRDDGKPVENSNTFTIQ